MSTTTTKTSTKKRKSNASEASAKRPRTSTTNGRALVNAVLNDPSFEVPGDEAATRSMLVDLAEYARELELSSTTSATPEKTTEELAAAAEKLRKAANSGIRKQMTWKPSCKTSSAKFVYDGVCPDPAVFGEMLGLGGPPTWKMKKIKADEFEDALGGIHASARYSTLRITSAEVTVRYSEGGEFKFSGSYGV